MEGALQPYQSNSLIDEVITPQEMAARLTDMKTKMDMVQQFFKEIMVPELDYGKIPGTDKPVLYKAGAEKLCELYGYAPVFKAIDEEKSKETGFYRARVTITLIHRRSGAIIAEGIGEANTMENRYRWRWVGDRDLPPGLEKENLVFKEYDGRNGKYKKYRVDNDDPWSLWNTVLKMAKKRAHMDATFSATRSSGIFSMDADEFQEWAAGADPEGDKQGKDKQQPGRQQPGQLKCSSCGAKISPNVATYSEQHFGKPLCQLCQKKPQPATTAGNDSPTQASPDPSGAAGGDQNG